MTLRQSSPMMLPLRRMREVPPEDASALLASLVHASQEHHIPLHDQHDDAELTLEEAYQYCTEMTRHHSRSFFLSSQFLPAEKRKAIRAFYAFCRTSDDIVDHAVGDASAALAHWVARVRATGTLPSEPVLRAWNDTAQRYDVPPALTNELLAGVAMDLTVSRYATFDDLWLYCYRVASVVGLVSMHIIGYREGAPPYAIDLGVALQLTNILRDVGEDARRGRIYLPQEDLARFGLTDDDILNGRRDAQFRSLMRFQIERAHALYDHAWAGIALLSPDCQFAIAAAADLYRGILLKIEQNDFDVFTQRAHLSTTAKILRLPRIWWNVRRLAPPNELSLS